MGTEGKPVRCLTFFETKIIEVENNIAIFCPCYKWSDCTENKIDILLR